MILLVSTDLMFAGPIRAAAKTLGHDFLLRGKIASPWAEAPPALIVVDLGSIKSGIAELAETARAQFPDVRLIAFGAHVNEPALEAAAAAGFDRVLTRGQLSRNPAGVLGPLLE